MIDMPQIGKRVKKQRLLLGMKQKELAELVNCDTHYISDIECGRCHPSADILVSLADHLDLSLDYMIRGRSLRDSCPPSLLQLVEMTDPEDLEKLSLILQYATEIGRRRND